MSKKVIFTDKAPQAIGPYSQGIGIGDFVFTSGQLPINPLTGELEREIKKATQQSLENVKHILESAGTSLDKVIKVNVFLQDMKYFAVMNEIYATYFPQNPPARSVVQVAGLPKDAIIEIEAIASVL